MCGQGLGRGSAAPPPLLPNPSLVSGHTVRLWDRSPRPGLEARAPQGQRSLLPAGLPGNPLGSLSRGDAEQGAEHPTASVLKKDWHLPHRAVLRTEQFHTCETAKAVPSINNNKCFYFYLIYYIETCLFQNREHSHSLTKLAVAIMSRTHRHRSRLRPKRHIR